MGYNILIVDDEPLIRRGIKAKLDVNKLSIDAIEEANDGIEAIKKLDTFSPNIIITDVRMPEMDGLQMIEEIKKLRINTDFVIISGYADFQYAKKAIDFGVKDYILKPIDPEELEKTLLKVMGDIQYNHKEEFQARFSKLNNEAEFINAKDTGKDIVNKVKNFIDNNYKEEISLNEISKKYFINSNYFSRIFKEIVGKGFTDYITNVRISKAYELIKDTNLNITSISKLVGYEDAKYFSKVFKKEMDISPSECVNKLRKNN